ncbi:hypothetical protein BKA93DRAFT_825498 [Sparassis latifolia]
MPGTTISERSSRPSPMSSPSWPPPRNPLPPHRLAKLANALGVSTPLPAVHTYAPSPSISPPFPHSSASSSFPDHFRSSPTPSAASAQTFTSHSSTKFLLHVVPPLHLPHDSDASDDLELSPPPPTASGYHAQFKRGVLVPVCPTLSSQLAAIAKEYALPSTAGMLLYLLASTPSPKRSHDSENVDALDEPGPRISEDIWRHIWLRVVKAEKDEPVVTSRRSFGLGISPATESSPNLLQDVVSNSLLPAIPPRRAETPQSLLAVTPSPSTPSYSGFSFQSELDTPESITSVSALGGADAQAEDFLLPGLHSPTLIPVLAKVEFDIDRRKAAWYEPWARSRRINHAKRAESRAGVRKRSGSRVDGDEGEDEDVRKAPLDLALVDKVRPGSPTPQFLRDRQAEAEEIDTEGAYSQLPESPEDVEFGDETDDDDPTARLNGLQYDPLADVFGTDAETWIHVHTDSQTDREKDPNVVDLALNGSALAAVPEDLEDSMTEDRDEEEVAELWNRHSKPSLVVSIPASPPSASRLRSSLTTAGTIKKQPPPPLNLMPSAQVLDRSHLPYLDGASPATSESTEYMKGGDTTLLVPPEDEDMIELKKSRSPEEEKRDGAFFEDLDLGLEFDESDPHDRRRSQVMMKAQLDEIERNLAQFSPHHLGTEELAESPRRPTHSASTLSPPSQWRSPRLNVQNAGSPPQGSAKLPTDGASWPAVPFSALSGRDASLSPPTNAANLPPSPPKFAFNGIPTEPPRSPFQRRTRSGTISDETLARRREQEEAALYPPLVSPLFRQSSGAQSPVIPLSPDPFGRFPSEAEVVRLSDEKHQQHAAGHYGELPPLPHSRNSAFRVNSRDQNDHDRSASQTPSSRFSLDSATSEEGPKPSKTASIVSMKGIKKLWRKTNNKLSLSGSATPIVPDSGRSSPNTMPTGHLQDQPPSRPMSRTISRSPQPGDHVNVSSDGMPVLVKKRRPSMHSLHVEVDGRYPVPSRTPPLDLSRGPSPQLPPVPLRTFTPDSAMSSPMPLTPIPSPVPPAEKNGSVRKSILKSWKSASGSLSAQSLPSGGPPHNGGTLHSEASQPPDVLMKRRRPSILDGIASARRGSVMSSSSATLVDIPPSPALPEQFAHMQSSRSSSRQSQLGEKEKRTSPRKQGSTSSSASSTSSPPRASSRLNPASSPPRHGAAFAARSSVDSGESRLDASQFEIVSPNLDSYVLESTLSYPYHALDHSMTSVE